MSLPEFKCSHCGVTLPRSHSWFRGELINYIARLGSQIVESRDRLVSLKKKTFSGRDAVALREENQKKIEALEAELPVLEGTFYGARFLEREIGAERRNAHK